MLQRIMAKSHMPNYNYIRNHIKSDIIIQLRIGFSSPISLEHFILSPLSWSELRCQITENILFCNIFLILSRDAQVVSSPFLWSL